MGHSTNANKQVNNPRKNPNTPNKPDVRDDLDSRKNEEFDSKGDNITHNEKETKKGHLKKKK